MNHIITTIAFVCIVQFSFAQTILFSEDFQGENIGDVTGVSAEGIPWTASCPSCATGDIFAVDNSFGTVQGLLGNDTNGPADFVASGIDATGMHIIVFEFDYESSGYSGSGNLECSSECGGCSGNPADVAIIGNPCYNCWDYLLWNLSTGTFSDGGMVLGDNCNVSDNGHLVSNPGCSSPYDANGNLIPGNDPTNLTITIQMAMWASAENMVIDNLIITGYTKLEAINAGLMASAGTDGTIDLCGATGSVNLFDELLGSPSTGGIWSGPSPTSGGYLGTTNLSTVSTGTYNYVVTTGSGCQDTASIIITSNGSGPTVTTTGNLDICSGNTTTITASGADTYLWSNQSTGATFSTASPGNYFVIGSNNCGSDTSFFTITTSGIAPIGILSGNLFTCDNNSSSTLTISGGNDYLWSTGSTITNETFNTGENGFVLITNSCGTDSIAFTISDGSISASFEISDTTGIAPLSVTTVNQSINATVYNWNFGDGSFYNTSTPSHTFFHAGTYSVVLTSTNSFGCSDNDTIVVIVTPIGEIVIPNIFTPNGDGLNNYFVVENSIIESIKGTIYNRWGNKLYESTGAMFSWDGTQENGKSVADGTYFYTFEIVLINAELREFSGTLMLSR